MPRNNNYNVIKSQRKKLIVLYNLAANVGTNFADKRGRSVGILGSQTQATEFFYYNMLYNAL
jgi:hypothetical protein